MEMPKSIKDAIHDGIIHNGYNSLDPPSQELVRRKKTHTSMRQRPMYTVLTHWPPKFEGQQVPLNSSTSYSPDIEAAKQYAALPQKYAEDVLGAWYGFHDHIPYTSFQQFFNKHAFCATMSEDFFREHRERFLILLADRCFLFPEYHEHGNSSQEPLLSEAVRLTEWPSNKSDSSSKKEIDQQQWKEVGSKNRILNQGMIPTLAHQKAFIELQNNLEELITAVEQRKACLKKYDESSTPDISIAFSKVAGREPLTMVEQAEMEKLVEVFSQYFAATIDRGYQIEYQAISENAEANARSVIRQMIIWFRAYPELTSWKELVYFHLFSQNTKRIASGTLHSYKLKAEIKRLAPIVPPKYMKEISRRRTYLNIMMFDYLLLVYPPKDLEYSKFRFYRLTRYVGFSHFLIRKFDPVDFRALPSPKDGVDNLGSALTRHIYACIPNYLSYLTPGLPNDLETSMHALATFLLRDSATKTIYSRLTDRIRRALNDPIMSKDLLSGYRKVYNDQHKLIDYLNSCCIKYRLEFVGQIDLPFWIGSPQETQRLCSRFLLEYALKEGIIKEARSHLLNIAWTLFGDLGIEKAQLA